MAWGASKGEREGGGRDCEGEREREKDRNRDIEMNHAVVDR